MNTTLPRVILVEDDASIRQFVAMALEDLPLQLLSCPNLHSAREALRLTSDDLALVLLDMMLPDGTGLDLLNDPIRSRPDLSANWVVFSAGMAPATRALLGELGVEKVLDKPVSLDLLVSCVQSACADWRSSRPPADAEKVTTDGSSIGLPTTKNPTTSEPYQASAVAADDPQAQTRGILKAQETEALQQYFFGQQALFVTMKEQTLNRLPDEIAKLDQLTSDCDNPQIQRAAHNLKSVTRMMGQTRASDLARALEDAAEHSDAGVIHRLWTGLRAELESWLADERRTALPKP